MNAAHRLRMFSMRCFILPLIAACLSACGPAKNIAVPLPPEKSDLAAINQLPGPDGSTVYIYEVETDSDRYLFQVQVRHDNEEGRAFNFVIGNENQVQGNVLIDGGALDTAMAQLNYFNSGTYELSDATSVWFSRLAFSRLLRAGNLTLDLKKPGQGFGSLSADGKTSLRRCDSLPAVTKGKNYFCEYNGTIANLDVVCAEGNWKGRPVRYAIMNDTAFPLILFMDIGFRIRLKQILQLHEMPDPLELRTGSVLKYVYMHIDSVAPETYDYIDDTLIIRLNRFDANGSAGVWALYRTTPEQAIAKGTCLNLFSQGTSDFSFWPDPVNHCSPKPPAFNGHCQGWWLSNPAMKPLRMEGNRTGFYFNGFSRFETWEIKADESGMFPRREEVAVNGADISCFAHRITPAGNISEDYMEFLPSKSNPMLIRWNAGGYQNLRLHSVSNP